MANVLILRQWSVTLRFVASNLKYGKMVSQDKYVSPFDRIFAFPGSLCLVQDLVHSV